MSERVRNQVEQWLEETEDDCESVLGVEDTDELEVDCLEQNYEENSDIDAEDEDEEVYEEAVNDADGYPSNEFDNREFYLGKDRVSRWFLESQVARTSRTQRHNIIPAFHKPGPQGNAKNASSPLESFECMIDNVIISKIVDYTNIYIDKIRNNFQRERDAKNTNEREIKAFLGVLLLAGALKSSRGNIIEMWDNSCGTGVEAIYVTMSEHRFRFLMRCLRFDNIHSREQRKANDKLAPIREVFDLFVESCKHSFKPSDYLTIDEQLVAFRGNCPFRQYIPSKPAKYGIKVFALVSASNFYTSNLEVYVGVQPEGPYRISNSPSDLVMRMVEPVANSNRNITCDNWFSSIPLAIKLRDEKKLTYIGTLRKNKKEIPPNFLPNKDREVNSCLFGFQEKCTMVSYVPKKNRAVVCISTMHDSKAIDPHTGDAKKPVIITTYNNTKHGVDILDKMCRQYDTARNSRRWPLTIFFHILNVAGVNALNIYRSNEVNSEVTRLNFLKTLAFDLMKPEIQHRIYLDVIPKEIKCRGRLLLKLEEERPTEEPPPKVANKGRCMMCGRARNKTTRKTCQKCGNWVCPDHQKSVCLNCL